MNRNDFLGMIESNGPSNRHSIGEISELLKIFPYCQSAHMLLLRGLKNTSDVRFDNQLRQSAMHVADREVLYYLLQKQSEPEPAEVPEPEKEPEPAAASVPEPRNITIPSPDDTEHEQTVIETARNSADLIAAIEKNEKASKTVSVGPVTFSGTISHEIVQEEASGESSASVLIIDDESGEIEEKVIYMDPGFSSWSDDEDLLELEKEEAPLTPEEEINEPPAAQTIEPQSDGLISTRKTQADLIDKFIEANPRIEPVRVMPDAPVVDIALKSTEPQEGFVTETLARIYVNQGYYSRAIDIYERLSLKFPEKSSYFATQIKKVKELIKK